MPLVRCIQIYASLMMYSHNCTQSSASFVVYKPFVGLILVARFDLMGNAKALHLGTSDRSWLHVPFSIWDNTINNIPLLESCGTKKNERYARNQIYVFWS